MSLSKLFQRIIWHNNTTPAINEDNLNAMSKAIDDIDDRVILIGDDVVTVIPQIQAYLEQAESIVEAVEELSQNPPYIGSNGNWWVFDTTLEAYKDSGVDASITVDIADITMIAEGAQPYVTNTGTSTDPVFHLFLPRSPQGATGNGIANIAKTSTQGLVDTYTITMTDGTTYTFTVTNGQGSGDMTKAVYDSTNAVADAGGIVAYVAAHSGAGTLAGLDDVTLSSLAAGDTLVYNATTQKWENSTVIQTLTNKLTATEMHFLQLKCRNVTIPENEGVVTINFTQDTIDALAALFNDGNYIYVLTAAPFTTAAIIMTPVGLQLYSADTYIRAHYQNKTGASQTVEVRFILAYSRTYTSDITNAPQ